jgi:hypothetical protein
MLDSSDISPSGLLSSQQKSVNYNSGKCRLQYVVCCYVVLQIEVTEGPNDRNNRTQESKEKSQAAFLM